MRAPQGGHRDVQWVIQFRRVHSFSSAITEVPAEEKLWTRHATALSGPATRATLEQLRAATFGLQWRAIRVETVQRAEDW